MDLTKDLLTFLQKSPTAWNAVSTLKKRLLNAEFLELDEKSSWKIVKGKSYFVIRNGSSLIAFKVPKNGIDKALVMASHTDSPALKIKPNAEFVKENMAMLGVEVYGSPILSSWLNRDLGIAGRVICLKKGKLEEHQVCLEDFSVVIPQLAIHLDRKVNEEGAVLNKQEHLAALFGIATKENNPLEKLLKQNIGFEKLIAHDLFLYPLEKPALIGLKKDFIASYRLDNLASMHAIIIGILAAKTSSDTLNMAVFWDNEEVGSSTAQGANSPFFEQALERVLLSLKQDRESFLRLLSNSQCISVDLVHAAHPNYLEKHEPRHPIIFEKGVVIKNSALKHYASDAQSSAYLLKVAAEENIPTQQFVARNDLSSGTTIGPIHARQTGMSTVDIGIPQLSMHAARELIAVKDHLNLCSLSKALYR